MVRSHLILVGSLIVFACTAVPRAQTPRPQPRAAAPENPLVSKGKNPFAGIFTLRQRLPDTAADRAFAASAHRQPRVVCGMLVVPVDPSADPQFVVREKPGTTEYKMPRIEPKVCRE